MIAVTPQGGKVARAMAISSLVEAGNVFLPHPQYAPWVEAFVEECAKFPNGSNDDQVDAMNTRPLMALSASNCDYASSGPESCW
jgi:predicted phage terminase large subunit-like protein